MRQVAEYTGLSPSTISNIVAGKHVPEPSTCLKLAEYFKVDPDLVLEMAGHRPSTPNNLPDFHRYVARYFKDSPEYQRALIAAYEAIRKAQDELAEKDRKREAEFREWLKRREEEEKREG